MTNQVALLVLAAEIAPATHHNHNFSHNQLVGNDHSPRFHIRLPLCYPDRATYTWYARFLVKTMFNDDRQGLPITH